MRGAGACPAGPEKRNLPPPALTMDTEHPPPRALFSRLSSMLSHELRNPLSSVKLSVQTLARNADLSERDRRRLAIAEREIRTLERMLTMFAEYGRERSAAVETVSLRELLVQAAESIAPELLERRQSVQVTGHPGPHTVRADAHRTRPVLAQLFLNAASALPAGAPVEVALSSVPGGGTQLAVRDLGATLSAEEQACVFEPFASRLARGGGLSLAALRQVMLDQEGRAEVHPDANPGTLFALTFAPG